MKLVIVVTLFVIVLVGMTHGKSHKVEEPDSKNRTQHSSNHATHKIEKVPQRNGTKVHRGTGREARQIGYGGNYGGLSSQLGGISSGYGYGYNNAIGLGGFGGNMGYGTALGFPFIGKR